jgi:ribonucleoside-diphosphate reductase alpha chain
MNENSPKIYSRKEVYKKTLDYFNGDELATQVWINKYCLKDSDGNLYEKSPKQTQKRIAKEFARIEAKYPNPLSEEEIYETLKNFRRIVPAGSPMTGIGNDFQIVSLSNCFVIGEDGPSDSYGGIMKTDQDQVQLMKRRGGVGHDLSHIRPKGSPVKNSALTSTGIVPFMERYSNSTKEVAPVILPCSSLASIKSSASGCFIETLSINAPLRPSCATSFVKIDDEFMEAVKHDNDYIQSYPIDLNIELDSGIKADDLEYNKITKGALGYYKKINARKLWKKIIHNAWKSAEPGILFWDTVINESIPDCYPEHGFKTVSTNPCGEIPLCPYDSCRLLSLNLYSYVVNPFTMDAYFDEELFASDVQKAMRYMDDIIDLELEKICEILEKIESDPEDEFIKLYEINLWEKIKKKTIEGRRTGLGVTGEGDMLAALGLTYGTDDANKFSEAVHRGLKLNAYRSSVQMAKERGEFPIYSWQKEMDNPFIQRIREEDPTLYSEMKAFGRRNISLLTVAPTGSLSIMTQTTSGIEPVFLPVYKRRRKINPNDKDVRVDFVDDEGISWMEYPVFHHNFETWLKSTGHDVDIVKSLTMDKIDKIVEQSPYHKATSNDVDWVKKVEMQGMIQKHVDHSISVTVNLPNDVTEETVAAVYEAGWSVGCKGITVYRDGSRSGVLISDEDKKKKERENLFKDHHAPKRPKRLKADIVRFQNNLEKWVAVVGKLDGRPYEIFTGKLENGLSDLPSSLEECEVVKKIYEVEGERKKRYDIEYIDSNGEKVVHEGLSHTFNEEYWNYAKMISGVLRHGMPMGYVYELVRSLNLNDEHLNTWKAGVERVIKKYIKDGEKGKGRCPECGSTDLEFKEGCLTCMSCGNSKCG